MWWDTKRIEATVTRKYVCSHLLAEEIERLNRPLGFGDGLTDGTYWEWIEQKAKRLFLILVDLGVPDQIFGVIDDSWDDEDLPIARDQVERLALTPGKDVKLETRFYYRQFHYILRPLEKGEHTVYEDAEVIALDIAEKKPGLASNQSVDRVTLPNHPGQALCRRRIPLGSGPGCLSNEDFLYEVNSIRNVQNEHLVSYFASYVHQGHGYVLFTPVGDFSLKQFLTTTPASFKSLVKQTRRQLLLNWIHCLVDTLTFLHSRGLSHGNIKPSIILFNNQNHIFFSDFTRLNAELLASTNDKSPFDKEAYDYAAPEQWLRSTSIAASSMHRKSTISSISTSPSTTTFSISRSASDSISTSPLSLVHAPSAHVFSPQAADIFSLGTIILELLTVAMKKTTRSFASHRAARHKTPGRGGAVPDSSFHKNLGQVESWMTQLAGEAKKKDDRLFRGVAPMLHLVERMLAAHPHERPAAREVQTRMYEILHDACGVEEPHCVHQYEGWEDFGMGGLAIRDSVIEEEGEERMSVATRRSSAVPSSRLRQTGSGGSGWGPWGNMSRSNSSAGGSVGEPVSPGARESISMREREPVVTTREREPVINTREREPPVSPRLKQSEIGSGLQAIQALRVRTNSSSGWQQGRGSVSVGQ
jgi:serine/threonine protein kinase